MEIHLKLHQFPRRHSRRTTGTSEDPTVSSIFTQDQTASDSLISRSHPRLSFLSYAFLPELDLFLKSVVNDKPHFPTRTSQQPNQGLCGTVPGLTPVEYTLKLRVHDLGLVGYMVVPVEGLTQGYRKG